MPKIISDYHTHTVMSHGQDTARDNIEAALGLGLSKIGIADHAPGHLSYGIRDMNLYVGELEKLQEEYEGRIKVKVGIEVDLCGLNGEIDMPEGYEDSFDVVILGFHKMAQMANFRSYLHFYTLRGLGGRFHVSRSTDAYLAALEGHRIDILAHPGTRLAIDVPALAEACAKSGTLLELSNANPDLTEAEIELAAKQGAKFVLASDAHQAGEVGIVDGVLKKALGVGLGKDEIINLA